MQMEAPVAMRQMEGSLVPVGMDMVEAPAQTISIFIVVMIFASMVAAALRVQPPT